MWKNSKISKTGGDVGSAVESIKFLKLQYYQIIN